MAYDVFISFKNTVPGGGLTVDRAIAERLHTKLRDEGLEVFFSEKDLSTTAFMDEIYQALDEANLLILIGSCSEYVLSEWVKSEWSTFFGAIKSGRKPRGEIMTVLQGMTTHQLPIQLEHYESFRADDLDSAVTFAFRSLRKVKRSEAAARLAEEQERKRREAEETALREVQRRMEAELALQAERMQSEDERISVAAQLRRDDEYAHWLQNASYDEQMAAYGRRHVPDNDSGKGIIPDNDPGKSIIPGKKTGRNKIVIGHTHDYEYTRQEEDPIENDAAKELRVRVSAEMLEQPVYVDEAPEFRTVRARIPQPVRALKPQPDNSVCPPISEEPHRRMYDETEEAAEREVLARMLNELT